MNVHERTIWTYNERSMRSGKFRFIFTTPSLIGQYSLSLFLIRQYRFQGDHTGLPTDVIYLLKNIPALNHPSTEHRFDRPATLFF